MSAVATPVADDPPYMAITVDGLSEDHDGGQLYVIRQDLAGPAVVRQADPSITIDADEMVVWDFEAPLGVPVTYSTLAVKEGEDNLAQTTSPVALDDDRVWLVHPSSPALSQVVRVSSLANRQRTLNRSLVWPVGRSTPIPYTDGSLKAPGGTLECWTETLTERDNLLALIGAASPTLLLNVPVSLGWGVGNEWVSFDGVDEQALVGGSQLRQLTLPYQVVQRPVGAVNVVRTWSDVLAESASWAEVQGQYETYLGLLLGAVGT